VAVTASRTADERFGSLENSTVLRDLAAQLEPGGKRSRCAGKSVLRRHRGDRGDREVRALQDSLNTLATQTIRRR
jgi:hypothetical protein